MKKISKNFWLLIILFVFSCISHFSFFGQPDQIVFDEVYFGKYASDYLTGSHYFDPHPPLGKLVIGGFGYLMGIRTDPTDYGAIGNNYSGDIRIWYRLLPSIFASLLPLVIFLLCLKLKLSKPVSFLVASLLILENSLVVHSRFVSLDSMLLFFGFSAFLTYLMYIEDEKNKIALYSSAIFMAATFSIKWTGLAFGLLIVIMEIIRVNSVSKFSKFIGTYIIIGTVFYMSVFAVHFSLLTKAGQGDAFVSQDFQKHSFVSKFIETNFEMYRVNATMTATHQYSSKWYSWPFMARTVFYWQDQESHRYIYFIGNVLIYWLGAISIILLIARGIIEKKINKFHLPVVIGYLVNFLPFILIGRVMFLYHYSAALVLSVVAIGMNVELISNKKIKIIVISLLIISTLLIFIFFSPLTYGLPLSDEALANRIWFKSWR